MNIKIPVCFSFETPVSEIFKKDPYIPFACGGYKNDGIIFSDSDGRIAGYNRYFNEMTLIQWAGDHMAELGDPDYIGVAHYRRYFDLEKINLSENDIICHVDMQPASIADMYNIYHVFADLQEFSRLLLQKRPEYREKYLKYMYQRTQHTRNMFVMHKTAFAEYSRFINECIDVLLEMIPKMNLDSRDKYQMRAPGFIMERMTGYWLYSVKDRFNLVDTPISEIDIDSIYQRV